MRRYSWLFFVIILLVLFGFGHVSGSIGDRLRVFRQNLVDCIQSNCSDQNTYYQNKPFYLQLLRWDCVSECRYESQWRTLEYLKKSKILKVPQFYGKWTFYRFFGIQEPASFFFSILNLLANLRGWKQYRTIGILCNDRYYNVWKLQAILAINAWFWSIIYHSRDCPFTEKLDYFSAYLTIIYSLFTITFKYLSELFDPNNDLTAQITIAIPFATIYLYHVNYLTTVRFDYGYNLRVNLLTGIGSTLGWLVWCLHHRKNRTSRFCTDF
ncbi:Post-GPI attachment to proteins factor 3 [Sarcoptes scabiei]|uniref:Post-GPI attachment to proteins factor 3 n=1 Tax=Sarcoptes scabiei TaxID=52283 RepID=A0A834RAZ8_SARSC|nr:Post-GPI attachment to proteins factor 3 [Sarcoptes scabiei]